MTIKTVCKAAAENSPACLETEPDERITVEEPGTEWIFTCPTRNWMMSHTGTNLTSSIHSGYTSYC